MMNLNLVVWVSFVPYALCIEPFTTASAAFIGAGVLYGVNKLRCSMGYEECCQQPWIANVTEGESLLKEQVEDKLFGQHIASNFVLKAVIAHRKKENPKKALVLSFHGCTGCGKNHLASVVARSLYKEGVDSKFVHLYIPHDFPHNEDVGSQKEKLRAGIEEHVKSCPEQLFIFDEMDEMKPQLIDVVKAFVDFYEKVGTVDYRKCIFIFLSNSGSGEIAKVTYTFWENGKNREDITYLDLENLIQLKAKEDLGGFQNSALIDDFLIDFFIPFLPMDKRNVRKCIRQEFKEAGVSDPSNESIEKILESLTFEPEGSQLFSKSGCKKIEKKVMMYLAGGL